MRKLEAEHAQQHGGVDETLDEESQCESEESVRIGVCGESAKVRLNVSPRSLYSRLKTRYML